jgi:predicted esterase
MRRNSVSNKTFHDLDQQLMRLYRAKEYQQAFELVEREYLNFPDQQGQIAYWRLCLHALSGKQAEALHIFREALDQGYWYPPRWLKGDPDLLSLQELPEFQEMVEICRQRLAEAHARPELLIEQPAQHATNFPLLIALHGNNSNAGDTMKEWSKITEQGWLLAVPQSSQIIGQDAFVWDDREQASNEIREHLAKVSGEYTIDPNRVVLGGFSMGGGQAIWMALHQSIKTRGFVVLGPYLSEDELKALPALLEAHKPTGVRGYILVGDEDHECLDISRTVVALLNARSIPCELEVRPRLDHSYPTDFAEVVSRGLAFIEQA